MRKNRVVLQIKSGSNNHSSAPVQCREGVVVAHHGVAVDVSFDDGSRGSIRVKRKSGHVVGDTVQVAGEVLIRLERKTELRRQDAMGGIHLVGANLDVLGIVIASVPEPPEGFIERAVVAARASGLMPFLVLNKLDLDGADVFVSAVAARYGGLIPFFSVSSETGDGVDQIRRYLAEGHRAAFVGTTGVGKSSLVNVLCPDIFLRIGALNEHTGKGCHTTTVATLHRLPDGGEIVDTPGFNDFGLVDISAGELSFYFPGFDHVRTERCRFRDCLHRSEPGCTVVDRVSRGLIPEHRYNAYMRLLEETKDSEKR